MGGTYCEMAKKIKWEYSVWKRWLPEIKRKIWHADDGCYKILRQTYYNGIDKKWTLRIGWTDIGRFKKPSDAKKIAQLIKNG